MLICLEDFLEKVKKSIFQNKQGGKTPLGEQEIQLVNHRLMKCRFKSPSTWLFLGPEVPQRDYRDIYYLESFSAQSWMDCGVMMGCNIYTGGEIKIKFFGLWPLAKWFSLKPLL